MKEMFTWVPWFTELAEKITEGGQEYLDERAASVKWGENVGEPLFGRESVDPLSFFAYLAIRTKDDGFKEAFLSVGQEFDLSSSHLAEGAQSWRLQRHHYIYYDLGLEGPDRTLAWELLRKAAAGNAESDVFSRGLKLKHLGVSTLSNILFLVNPRSFLPLQGIPEHRRTYGLSSAPSSMAWSDYSSEISRIATEFPGCEFYEVELFGRLQRWSGEGGVNLEVRPDQCWLVSTRLGEPGKRRDHWSDSFQRNNWIQTGRKYEGLTDAATGDIVLVRCGVTKGRGIGVVLKNGYERGWTPEDAIDVLWLNKTPANLKTAALAAATSTRQTRREAFLPASPNEEELFRVCPEYRPTWRLLDRIMYCGEIEAALDADRNQLGVVWRLLKKGRKISEIRLDMGNAHTIRQIHQLLLEDRVPPADTIRKAASSTVSRFARDHKATFSAPTEAKLGALIRKCDGSSSSDPSDFDPKKHRPSEPTQGPEVRHDPNQILYGPPGTGKTYTTVCHALAIIDGDEVKDDISDEDRQRFRELRFESAGDLNGPTGGRIAMVTFHQNYAYEDFVEGIRPRLVGSDRGEETEVATRVAYEMRPGIFRKICAVADAERETARTDGRTPKRFVLIIDEINRGNIPKIFGELITLIEPSKRLGKKDEVKVTRPYSGHEFGVPDNLYIIGTMNTADRSIQQLDTALRRRFTFVERMPGPEHKLIAEDIDGVNCRKMLQAMNERIVLLLDREHQIGHTYLLNVETMGALADRFRNQIFPLLQEYFYDDWRKIHAVLGENAFVKKRKAGEGYTKAMAAAFDLIEENKSSTNASATRRPSGRLPGNTRRSTKIRSRIDARAGLASRTRGVRPRRTRTRRKGLEEPRGVHAKEPAGQARRLPAGAQLRARRPEAESNELRRRPLHAARYTCRDPP